MWIAGPAIKVACHRTETRPPYCRTPIFAPCHPSRSAMRQPSEAARRLLPSAPVAGLLAIALLVAAAPAARADGGTFSFGLWGDMPYARAKDQPKIAPLIADMNAADIAFSLYDGDIK